MTNSNKHQVVVIGGGFGGLKAVRGLKRCQEVEITLVDRCNFHLFQPLLYQVATGGLSPANIAAPLRSVLRRQKNVRVWMENVIDLDVSHQKVILENDTLSYDSLIVAAGSGHSYFGHDQDWQPHAPGLKTVEEALEIRRRLYTAFEWAEREPDDAKRSALLTFIVVGAGPTGVELAGAVAEIALVTMKEDFRAINPAEATILLLDAGDRVLPAYPPKLSTKAQQSLESLGVTVRLHALVQHIDSTGVTIGKNDASEHIASSTVLWAAGVRASPLAQVLADAAGLEITRGGQVPVQNDLTLDGHPEIFALGDMAFLQDQAGQPLPGIAPVALQQGAYAAQAILKRLREGPGVALGPFRYHHRGSMATIGRSKAVADLGWTTFSGPLAWLAWLLIHLMFLVQHSNRVLVFFQWAYNYFSRNRSARIITGR